MKIVDPWNQAVSGRCKGLKQHQTTTAAGRSLRCDPAWWRYTASGQQRKCWRSTDSPPGMEGWSNYGDFSPKKSEGSQENDGKCTFKCTKGNTNSLAMSGCCSLMSLSAFTFCSIFDGVFPGWMRNATTHSPFPEMRTAKSLHSLVPRPKAGQ